MRMRLIQILEQLAKSLKLKFDLKLNFALKWFLQYSMHCTALTKIYFYVTLEHVFYCLFQSQHL